MRNFAYSHAATAAVALRLAGERDETKFLGGGTNLVDLMRENIESPAALVDVTGLSSTIEDVGGGLRIGAATSNTAVANDRRVRERYPMLSQAILCGASGQIRNAATVGGNLLQRTRCGYFYEHAARCNKRTPGSGCDAIEGYNRSHAILGWSPACIAVFPSDLCVALAALDATVLVEGAAGARTVPFADFHRLPGDTPHIETSLQVGELITAIELPKCTVARGSIYRKIRDRASYAFALVSVAAALDVEGGKITDVRIALGGVAHKPWRAAKAEASLRGCDATDANFNRAADLELESARGFAHNDFKIELAKRAIVAALGDLIDHGDAR